MSGKEAVARRLMTRSSYPNLGKTPGGRRLFVLRTLRERAVPVEAPRNSAPPKAS